MEEKELDSLAQVIKNKIIQDSIILLEMRSTYVDKVDGSYNVMHFIENISESVIKKNILNGTDLHWINGHNISWFVTSDLNVFFKNVVLNIMTDK